MVATKTGENDETRLIVVQTDCLGSSTSTHLSGSLSALGSTGLAGDCFQDHDKAFKLHHQATRSSKQIRFRLKTPACASSFSAADASV